MSRVIVFCRYIVQFPDDVRQQKRRSGVGFQNDRLQLLEELVRGRFIRRSAVRPVVRVGRLQRRREYIIYRVGIIVVCACFVIVVVVVGTFVVVVAAAAAAVVVMVEGYCVCVGGVVRWVYM